MPDLTVALIQTSLHWENPPANLAMFDTLIDSIGDGVDLVVLPEMFTTGFTMTPGPVAQTMDGPAVTWLKEKSRQKRADIAGSIVIAENGGFYNRLVWAKPEGTLLCYDKRHLFRMTGEHQVYAPGQRRLTVALNGWRLRPFICYDLRFPVWLRNRDTAYDLAVVVANWPKARQVHWQVLLAARAIENQACVVAVNRIGADGNGLVFAGGSVVLDAWGRQMWQGGDKVCVQTVVLQRRDLDQCRRDFPAWMDADRFCEPDAGFDSSEKR